MSPLKPLWTEFNETWQEVRSQSPLPSSCFSDRLEKQDGHPCFWSADAFLTSPLKLLNGIQRNLTGSKILVSSTEFVFFFFGPIGKTRWPPWHLISWDIFDFSSEIQRNLTGSEISTSSTKFVFFGLIGKQRWPPWPLIGWDIIDFSTERNSTKLDGKEDLNILYQVCVFRADRKTKMSATISHWLIHFRLPLWNRWKEFNESWHEAGSQRLLPSLCFSSRTKMAALADS